MTTSAPPCKEIVAGGLDRATNEIGPIVERIDGDSVGESLLDFDDFVFHAIGNNTGVFARQEHDHTDHALA